MNNLLLDTHALIWFLRGDKELSTAANSAIRSHLNERYVSVASLWEITIKVNLGKIELDFSVDEFENLLAINDLNILPIGFWHLVHLSKLPLLHRDPFDRLLIAQAAADHLTIVTRDPHFAEYGIRILW